MVMNQGILIFITLQDLIQQRKFVEAEQVLAHHLERGIPIEEILAGAGRLPLDPLLETLILKSQPSLSKTKD